MSDLVSKADPTRIVRQQLMRIGGTFSMIMGGSNLMPEEVASSLGVPVEQITKLMTGSDLDVPISILSRLATTLGSSLMIGVSVPQKQAAQPADLVKAADPTQQ